ncbi:IclR family transcriptional regulator [Streptomyces sp. NBC_01314]|uniref:IclR family transcriptional regulator n=1 Tax=Streptomyces sp. NBC_01314 TaxID=2903821 RepID=UPI00308F53AE|nr:IclR family transcriptional regulator [Streptomyces sp. NBC_01314]
MSYDGGIASVERALELMEALLDGPVGATALAARMGVSKATAFRIARTLQNKGYVVQLDDTRYTLGPRCLMLAAWAFGHIDIRRELRWAEEEIYERTGETVLLSVLAGRSSVCVDSIPSKHSVVSIASVGEVWPAHTSSAGLSFLADDPTLLETYLEEPLQAATGRTVADPDELRRLLAQYRADGYAVNRGYWRDGVCAVGAVVHDASGRAIAALSAMMPEFRLEEAGVEELGLLVMDVAARASERLGYRGSKPVNPTV